MFLPENEPWLATVLEKYKYQQMFKTALPYDEEDADVVDAMMHIDSIIAEREEQVFKLNAEKATNGRR